MGVGWCLITKTLQAAKLSADMGMCVAHNFHENLTCYQWFIRFRYRVVST